MGNFPGMFHTEVYWEYVFELLGEQHPRCLLLPRFKTNSLKETITPWVTD